MIFTVYSFLMATLASSLMIVLIYLIKKTKYFSVVFNVPFIVALYALSLLRMAIPFEIPNFQLQIRDEYVLAPIMDVFENRSDITKDLPIMMLDIVGVVAVFVCVVLIAVFVTRQLMYTSKLKKLTNHATLSEQQMLDEVVATMFKRKRVTLIKTDFVSMPMVTGFFKSIVLLPNDEYSDEQLRFIFVHECTHIKNNDLLLKLLIHIYCCIFWWNPFVYLLKSDVDFLLELKCDNKACRDMDELTKLDYIKAINDNAIKLSLKNKRRTQLVSSGFAFKDGTKRHVHRMKNLLYPKRKSKTAVVISVLLSVAIAAIWAASFLIIWQPSYTMRNSEMLQAEVDGVNSVMSDETNAYLVEQVDGNYIFYFDGVEIPVSKAEFDAGGYETYPIYDEPK